MTLNATPADRERGTGPPRTRKPILLAAGHAGHLFIERRLRVHRGGYDPPTLLAALRPGDQLPVIRSRGAP